MEPTLSSQVTSTNTSTSTHPHHHDKPTTLRGHLKKQSPAMLHKWQKRFFVLFPQHLSIVYYKKEEDVNEHHKSRGHIDLKDIKSVEYRGGTEFHLVTHDRTYNLQAYSIADKNMWVNGIRAVREAVIDANAANLDRSATHVAIETALQDSLAKLDRRTQHLEEHNVHLDSTVVEKEKMIAGNDAVIVEKERVVTEFPAETLTVDERLNNNHHHHHHHHDEHHTHHTHTEGHVMPGQMTTSEYVSRDGYNPNLMREFFIIERTVGELADQKMYKFKAPMDSEINIRFTKASLANSEHFATTTHGTNISTAALERVSEVDRRMFDSFLDEGHNSHTMGGHQTLIESKITGVDSVHPSSTYATDRMRVDETYENREGYSRPEERVDAFANTTTSTMNQGYPGLADKQVI